MNSSAEEAISLPPSIDFGSMALVPKCAGVKRCSPVLLICFKFPVSEASS